MEKEVKVDVLDDTQKDDQVVDLTKMTREEVEEYAIKQAKKATDQEGLAKKLKNKLDTPADPEPKDPTPEPVITPEPVKTEPVSLDEQHLIANLATKFSLEEIKEGQSFIGTSFGKTLADVTTNPGFLAHIAAKRELSKSESMIEADPIHIDTFQSKESFVRDVEAGNIDLTADPDARQKYIDIKAEEEAAKNFG